VFHNSRVRIHQFTTFFFACSLVYTFPLAVSINLHADLDMQSIDALADALNNFSGGVVLVSHDFRLIDQVAKEVWVVDENKVSTWCGCVFASVAILCFRSHHAVLVICIPVASVVQEGRHSILQEEVDQANARRRRGNAQVHG
jgi:energy-coupling factor transporter ATP-binding protein EcfA2